MKKLRILFALLLCVQFTYPLVSAGAVSSFSLDAAAGILVHPESGVVLYEKDADVRVYPASITKVMTALLLVEAIEAGELSADQVVTASDTFEFDMEADGSSQYIKPGEEMTLEALLYCIMVASANEACNIVAELHSGTVAEFVELMNQRALELGCTGTHYTNTHGLHNDEHYTTARDVYLISAAAMTHPLFVELSSAVNYTVPATNLTDPRQLKNTNMLITDHYNGYYNYEYCIGGKTGRTSKAGNCLVSHAIYNNDELICVVMGAESETVSEDIVGSKSFSQSIALYKWGYANYAYHTVISTGDMITEATVIDGDNADYVVLHPAGDMVFYLPLDYDFESFEPVIRLNSATGVKAPIMQGQTLGMLDLYQGEHYLGSVDLISLTAVAAAGAASVPAAENESSGVSWLVILLIAIIVAVVLYVVLLIINTVRRNRRRAAAGTARRLRK